VEVVGAVVELDGGHKTNGGWIGFIWGFGKGSFDGDGLFGGGRKLMSFQRDWRLTHQMLRQGL
jgi:hypothetical protein